MQYNISSFVKEYLNNGFLIFPCHTITDGVCSCGRDCGKDAGKHPLTTQGVKDATSNLETAEAYFAGDYAKANIAIATGEPSGVFVVDIDDLAALTKLESEHGPLPKTWLVETGSGGKHYYFSFDDRCRNLKNATKIAGAIDIRTTGGYVLAPPSRHRSGKQYRWIVSPHDCELASLPDWLLNIIPKIDVGISTKANAVTSFAVRPTASEIDKAKRYLDKIPPAISGEGGNKQTFAAICKVVELFKLSNEELLDALSDWNSRCVPSWKEYELRQKITNARKTTNKQEAAPVTEATLEPEPEQENDDIFPTLDEAAYVGLTGEIVKAIEPETEADPAGVLISLLAVFGSAVGKEPSFAVGAGEHYTNLFVCLVGDTASGKGQALDVVEYLFKIAVPFYNNDVSYGLSSGEGLIERVADPEPDKDKPFVFAMPPVKRLLCIETEFAKPITAMRREGNTLSTLLRSAWDGKTLEVLNRNTTKLKASSAHISIIGHITQGELDKILSQKQSVETTNGFANRFLWVCVRSTRDLPNGGDITVLLPYVDRLKEAIAFAKTVGEMERSEEAERLWKEVYAQLKYGTVKVTERARAQVVRLSMIYALLDW